MWDSNDEIDEIDYPNTSVPNLKRKTIQKPVPVVEFQIDDEIDEINYTGLYRTYIVKCSDVRLDETLWH